MDSFEKKLILQTIELCGDDKKQISLALQLNRGLVGKTAEHLSVNRRTLAWKITKLGIDY